MRQLTERADIQCNLCMGYGGEDEYDDDYGEHAEWVECPRCNGSGRMIVINKRIFPYKEGKATEGDNVQSELVSRFTH